MTAYEGVMLVIGILGLLIPMIGIIVKLIIAYIDAKNNRLGLTNRRLFLPLFQG